MQGAIRSKAFTDRFFFLERPIILLQVCSTCSELSSNISTIVVIFLTVCLPNDEGRPFDGTLGDGPAALVVVPAVLLMVSHCHGAYIGW